MTKLRWPARFERTISILFLGILGLLKIVFAFTVRIDSDETQHLHVVWGWSHGFLPYRDLFDNHSPLFQFLYAPLFRALGERADIVIPMRLAVVPLYFICLWCAYRFGKILFSRRAGLWAAVLTGAFPTFFVKSSEFRTDDLWAALWSLSILVLLSRPFRMRNAFLAGLAVGASFATSMKTSVLAVSLGIALFAILLLKKINRENIDWKRLSIFSVAFVFAAALLPLIVFLFFYFQGALPNLYYGVIQHNLVSHVFRAKVLPRFLLVAPLVGLAALGSYLAWRASDRIVQRDRIALLAFSSIGYLVLLGGFWPLVQAHDILPVAPSVFVFVLPIGRALLKPFTRRPRYWFQTIASPLLTCIEIGSLLLAYPPRRSTMADKISMISNVLRLTQPNDFVMDPKGEFVFRRRPFYYVLEAMTFRRLRLGLIKGDIPERLVATRTAVATTLRLPRRAEDFVERNYLPVGFRTRVLGKMLDTDEPPSPKTYSFDIAIPARYTIVSERGRPMAVVDQTPLAGSRFLQAGHHQAVISGGAGRLALIWARATEEGFSPFTPRAIDPPIRAHTD